MFNFLKNRKLKDIQAGKVPFYSFPDKHKQTSWSSLASIIPVMLSSEKLSVIIARDPKSSASNEAVLKLSRRSLTIINPERSDQIDLCLEALAPEVSANEFSIRSQNAKKLALDIENIIKVLLSISGNYDFECFWDSAITNQVVAPKDKRDNMIKNESLLFLEKKYGLFLPMFYKNFLLGITRKGSTRDNQSYDQLFVTEDDLLLSNDRVRNTLPYNDIWQDDWFVIGTDGSGNDYFITTKYNNENIYELDHEQVQDKNYKPLQHSRFSSLSQVPWKLGSKKL